MTDRHRPGFINALREMLAYAGAGVAVVVVIVGAFIVFVLWWAS